MKLEAKLSGKSGEKKYQVELERHAGGWQVKLDGKTMQADCVEISVNTLSLIIDGVCHEIRISPRPDGTLAVQNGLEEFTAEIVDPRAWRGRHGHIEVEGSQQITAPMAGKVVRLLVKSGDTVEAGQGLLVVEAMKMQNEIRSPKSGKVERLQAQEGQLVNAGEVLAWID